MSIFGVMMDVKKTLTVSWASIVKLYAVVSLMSIFPCAKQRELVREGNVSCALISISNYGT